MMSEAPAQKICFGSVQDRKLFPLHFPPDRLGNEMSRPEAPHLGPGCYDSHEFGTIVYNLQKTPGSKKGYALSARTAARFPASTEEETPSPTKYQPDQTQTRVPPPGKTPFSSTTQRFDSRPSSAGPCPGAYAHDVETNRKVEWPMCFGRPDWSRMPQPKRKSLRVKLDCDKEHIKFRSRLAYLSLYY